MSEGRIGKKNHRYGKSISDETRNKISEVKGLTIYLYTLDFKLIESFFSSQKAGKYFGSSNSTILKYARSGAIFKNEYVLSFKELPITSSEF